MVLCATVCSAIPRELLYPHGAGIDLVLPQDQDEAASPEIALQVPIVFYGETYNAIYVSSCFFASSSPSSSFCVWSHVVRFKVFMEVNARIIFRVMTSCSLLGGFKRFGGTFSSAGWK
jgi:hypothetical protein